MLGSGAEGAVVGMIVPSSEVVRLRSGADGGEVTLKMGASQEKNDPKGLGDGDGVILTSQSQLHQPRLAKAMTEGLTYHRVLRYLSPPGH